MTPGWRPRWPRRLERRIALLIIGLAMLIAVGGGMASMLLTQTILRSSVDEQLRTISRQSHADVRELTAEAPPGSVAIWDSGAQPQVAATGPNHTVTTADRHQLERLLATRTGFESVKLPDRDDMRVYVSDKGGHRELVALDTDSIEHDLAQLGALEFVVWALCGAVAAVVGIAVTRHFTRHLRDVAHTATSIADEPVDSVAEAVTRRVDDAGTTVTEVDSVVHSMNALLGQIESAMRRRDESEEALRTFLADVSHELRTPIAVARSHAELGRQVIERAVLTDGDDEARRETTAQLLASLERIERESDRMGRLVEDLLLLARLEGTRRPDVTRVDLTFLALEALSDAKVLAADHEWGFAAPSEPVELDGDVDGIRRVLTNLVTNARKHTPAGTRVTVSVGVGGTGDVADADEAWLRVGDDGPGLPAHVAEAPGERFTGRNRADSSSSGLGLAITRSLVTSMSGRMTFETGPEGTAITVVLPMKPSR